MSTGADIRFADTPATLQKSKESKSTQSAKSSSSTVSSSSPCHLLPPPLPPPPSLPSPPPLSSSLFGSVTRPSPSTTPLYTAASVLLTVTTMKRAGFNGGGAQQCTADPEPVVALEGDEGFSSSTSDPPPLPQSPAYIQHRRGESEVGMQRGLHQQQRTWMGCTAQRSDERVKEQMGRDGRGGERVSWHHVSVGIALGRVEDRRMDSILGLGFPAFGGRTRFDADLVEGSLCRRDGFYDGCLQK
ncbi:hypothetical protein C8R45DRAFT_946223 [Mycena sanguinolenta]|nr:hypothetical protein C8R45DRAFT_946223 [Mycena sanguinolenta]